MIEYHTKLTEKGFKEVKKKGFAYGTTSLESVPAYLAVDLLRLW